MQRTAVVSIAAAIAGLLSGEASARDMARGASSAYSWTGFYIGANGGYGWHDRATSFNPNDLSASVVTGLPGISTALPPQNFDNDGGFGGFQIGVNWQFHPRWLAGIEADLNWADMKGVGASSNVIVAAVPGTGTVSEQIKWFGTVRARLGYLVTNELLLYGTGGFAFGRVERTADYTTSPPGLLVFGNPSYLCTANVACFAGSTSGVETGWTIGGGAEWALWHNLTFKAEYFYVNLGGNSLTIAATAPFGGVSSIQVRGDDVEFHAVRAGLNYRF